MSLKLKIILKAVQIRLDRGEELDEILDSYKNLTDEEKSELKNAI